MWSAGWPRGGRSLQLAVVGDGPARQQVEERAAKANATARPPGGGADWSEERPAAGLRRSRRDAWVWAARCLRGLAFGKPLVVQGEGGFWQLLTPQSAPTFLDQGWYGLADDVPGGAGRLAAILAKLLADPELRLTLGRYGRQLVVERFSLERAAAVQEEVYLAALDPARRRQALSQRPADVGQMRCWPAALIQGSAQVAALARHGRP